MGGVAQVIAHLLCKHEALSTNPERIKHKKIRPIFLEDEGPKQHNQKG
jgi:hypothetical protein